MKIRIKDNSVRLRLTQDEVKKFELSKEVKAHTSFINGTMLTYKLVWRNDEMFQGRLRQNLHSTLDRWCVNSLGPLLFNFSYLRNL
mgnify:CR=1 FL=1